MGESRSRAAAALVCAASTLLLQACGTQVAGSSGGVPDGYPTVSVTQDRFGSCPKTTPQVPQDHGSHTGEWWLDAAPIGSFEPVAVVFCETLGRDAGGRWQTYGMVEKRHDDGFDDLLAALRLPDTPPQDGTHFCDLELELLETFVLVAADGASILPRLPQDACNDVLPEVGRALEALRSSPPDQTTTYETEPSPGDDVIERAEDAQSVGCPDVSKNIALIDAAQGARGDAAPRLGGSELTLCLMTPEGGIPEEPLIAFVGGTTLGDVPALAIDDALTTAKPGLEPCDSEPAEAVIVSVKGGTTALFAELGGCLRMSVGGFVGTVSPELLEVLATYADQARPTT